MAILAIVNMIFRGDGKNNIINDSCFAKNLQRKVRNGDLSAEYIEEENDRPPVTKTLMNPPFALKKSDEKEYVFIDYALKQMLEGGLLFAIVLTSIMYAGDNFFWRKSLLDKHTLLSVIKFPNELFYPQASVETVGIIIRSKIPHNMNNDVLWVKMDNDGYKKWKRRRFFCSYNEIPIIEENIKEFIHTNKIKDQLVEFIETRPIDEKDDKLDLIPQNYLGTRLHTIQEINSSIKQRYFDLLNEQIKEEIR